MKQIVKSWLWVAAAIVLFTVSGHAQSVQTKCLNTPVKGEIKFDKTGNIVLNSCPAKLVIINGIAFDGTTGGIVSNPTLLSVTGATVAVADNDARVGLRVGANGFASINAALTAASTTKAKISYSTDQSLTAPLIVPATAVTAPEAGAQIIATPTNYVEFKGIGLTDPLSTTAVLKASPPSYKDAVFYLINPATDTLNIANHGLSQGQQVIYRNETGAAGGLVNNGIYYVVKIDNSNVKLSLTQNGGAIDITSTGAGQGFLIATSVYWTTNVFPNRVSTELIDTSDNSLTKRQQILVSALWNKRVTIVAYPRTITTTLYTSDNQSLFFTDGEYPNTRVFADNTYLPCFYIGSNTTFSSSSWNTLIYEPQELGNGQVIATRSNAANVHIFNNHFKGTQNSTNGASASIALNDTFHSSIKNNYFENMWYYNAFIGGGGHPARYGFDNEISGNLFTGSQTQVIAVIRGNNTRILNNRLYIYNDNGTTNGNSQFTPIDIEPNESYDNIDGVRIEDNYINFAGASLLWHGIIVQSPASEYVRNIQILRNRIIGSDAGQTSFMGEGINVQSVSNVLIAENQIEYSQYAAINITFCRDVIVRNNRNLGESLFITNAAADVRFFDNFTDGQMNEVGSGNTNEAGISEYIYWLNDITGGVVSPYQSVTTGGNVPTHLKGLQVEFNNTLYTINSVLPIVGDTDYRRHFTTTPAIPNYAAITISGASINAATGEFTTPANHNYLTGAIVFYRNESGTAGGFQDYQFYYVITTAPNKFKLADTKTLALAGTAKIPTAAGGNQVIYPATRTAFLNTTYKNNDAKLGYQLDTGSRSQILSKYGDAASSVEYKYISDVNYTLIPRDKGKVLVFTSNSNITLTIPNNLGAGFNVSVRKQSASANYISFVAGAGTSYTAGGDTKTLTFKNVSATIDTADGIEFIVSGATQP